MDIKNYLSQVITMINSVDPNEINDLAALINATKNNDKSIFVFGNGGSGANASHFVQDLNKCPIKNFSVSADRYKAFCLNDNIPIVLAYANDLSYDQIFVQQLMNFCKPGDLVIGISGSGNSLNVIKAVEYANQIGAKTVGIVGFGGGKLLPVSQHSVHIKVNDMQVYEDGASIVLHSIIKALLN